MARQFEDPTIGLHDPIGDRSAGSRTFLRKAGDRAVNERRLQSTESIGVYPEPLGHARSKILDHDVGPLDEAMHYGPPLLVL
jgi:hypothetical protein